MTGRCPVRYQHIISIVLLLMVGLEARPLMAADANPPASAHDDRPLGPEDLLLIYNQRDPRSRELAEYYAEQRKVPDGRLCPVTVAVNKEVIGRGEYDQQIKEPIRRFLQENELQDQVRCLVTFYGLPIRVGAKQASATEQKRVSEWRQTFLTGLKDLQEAIAQLESIGTDQPPESPRKNSEPPGEAEFPQLLKQYQQAKTAAWQRVMPQVQQGQAQAREHYQQLIARLEADEGQAVIISQMKAAPGPSEQARAGREKLEQLQQQLAEAERKIQAARERELHDPKRAEASDLISRYFGLIGWLQALHSDLTMAETAESQAAVDSELMLLWWDNYPLHRWVFNPLNWRFRADPGMQAAMAGKEWQKPVLLVARIDAPSMRGARRIIDDSLAAEADGLEGKVYIDIRGLGPAQEGLVKYDYNLFDLAKLLEQETDLPVTLNRLPGVFQPGECPEAMLYCGWYSLRKYVDAFEFVPGAVGYHIASFEAISLHKPGERGWVSNLLDNGIAATLGPVAEPYLAAFPEPKDFFGLLLTGRYSLAECYGYTATMNSWMMMLIGDPLYRPFATNPHLTLDEVFETELIPADPLRAGTLDE